ncbi:hypothetical protein INR49_020499 [Caranx melampygus]|nr:hypothetical protein INR49_020499 [Caranx melampygus]
MTVPVESDDFVFAQQRKRGVSFLQITGQRGESQPTRLSVTPPRPEHRQDRRPHLSSSSTDTVKHPERRCDTGGESTKPGTVLRRARQMEQ